MRLAALDRSTVGLLLQSLPQAKPATDHEEPKRVCPQPSLFLLLQRLCLWTQPGMVGPGQHYVVQRLSASQFHLAQLAQDHQARYRASTAGNADQGPSDERLQTLQPRSGKDSGRNCHGRSRCAGLGVVPLREGGEWRAILAKFSTRRIIPKLRPAPLTKPSP